MWYLCVGQRLAQRLLELGWTVSATVTTESKKQNLEDLFPEVTFWVLGDDTKSSVLTNGSIGILDSVTHVLSTAPVNKATGRDPVLEQLEDQLKLRATTGAVKWAGYLSTTGVYGDTKGQPVDETSPCNRTFLLLASYY